MIWRGRARKLGEVLMTYARVQPVPTDGLLDSSELRALSSVWKERKAALESDGAYKDFIVRLQREWAIETGIIERLYTWDRGVTEVLIEQGIESSIISHRGGLAKNEAEHVEAMIKDHLAIVEGLFGYIKREEPLSEHFIRGLQAQFTENQDFTEALTDQGFVVKVPLKKGEYKSLPNNPRRADGTVHVYCPPEFTREEMQSLIENYRRSEDLVSVEVRAAWLHHRFTQIHPFQDGNGRVARALASLIFLRDGLFPLVVRESDRREYIGALESADDGNLEPLVAFFSRRQRDAILKALGLEQQVQQNRHADQILSSALQILKDRFSKEEKKLTLVYEHAGSVMGDLRVRLESIASNLNPQLRELTPPNKERYQARCNHGDNESASRHYFQRQIVETARYFDYYANLEKYRGWVRLTLTTSQDFDFVVSIHGYGPGDTGILAASAFTFLRAHKEGGGTEPVGLHPAAVDLFQFNYAESLVTTRKRFAEWLESSLAIALAEWKRTL
ncbi:MAG: Fic family protein [Ahniella sp.]|nr:Fic family protein [Ahniella sp.]